MSIGIRMLLCVLLCTPLAHAQDAVEGPLPQLAGAAAQANTSAPPPAQSKLLENASIIKMTTAGLDDGIILQTVRSQPGDYHTGPDDLIALKTAGVSQGGDLGHARAQQRSAAARDTRSGRGGAALRQHRRSGRLLQEHAGAVGGSWA